MPPLPNKPFTNLKSKPGWDWTGARPNLQLHLAFSQRVISETQTQFVFTDAYVSKVLQSVITTLPQKRHELSFQAQICQTLPGPMSFMSRPIQAMGF